MSDRHQATFSGFGPNAGYIEDLYKLYLQDPKLVGPSWSEYFSKITPNNFHSVSSQELPVSLPAPTTTNGRANTDENSPAPLTTHYQEPANKDEAVQERIYRMVSAFRNRGHLKADINPLTDGITPIPKTADIDVSFYNFTEEQLDRVYQCAGFAGEESMLLRDLIAGLEIAYCNAIGFEIQHLLSQEQRLWLQKKIERRFKNGSYRMSAEQKIRRLQKIIDAELFEEELHKKYVGHKRFSLQGAETVIPMLNTILEHSGTVGVKAIVLGMAHRGRLNVLRNILGKSLKDLFSEFEDQNIFSALGSGDVKYHMGFKSTYMNPEGDPLELELAPNPSHLEFVYPVVEGMVRAKQDFLYGRNRGSAIGVLLHGDAAFVGQGVVAETLNLTGVDAFKNGGSIHIIINNQVGFTTSPSDSRTSTYCTDFAKAIQAPIFHINCEHVVAACWAAKLAVDFSKRYGRDVVLDLYCYRKYGHNEGDDPSYTQPVIYREIKEKRPISEVFADSLMDEGTITQLDIESYEEKFKSDFSNAHSNSKNSNPYGDVCPMHGRLRDSIENSGVDLVDLQKVALTLIEHPDGFVPHPKLQKILEKRVATIDQGHGIDWGFAEALAFGSLVLDGKSVRLCGQDCGRGTFSQRHLVLHHYETGESFTPFSQLSSPDSASFEVFNSTLSEAAVLGYEFGYSAVAGNKALVLWEAQFGDFANGAQVIIDQFLSSSEQKWHQMCGLVLLLPHGYEGQGPEHSSARLERFLQQSADGNMFVCVPSNAAQHFHMLRRQGLSEITRPLVVMTPKSLLRLPQANCTIDELTSGDFKTVLVNYINPDKPIDRVIFLTGKVYYDTMKKLEAECSSRGVAIVRLEQLYPFPKEEIKALLQEFASFESFWLQEEPKNMGAWHFCEAELRELGLSPTYIGRVASASTATGSSKRHNFETEQFLTDLMKNL